MIDVDDPQVTDPKQDKILEQLGLHPSQISTRQQLGLEQGPPSAMSAPPAAANSPLIQSQPSQVQAPPPAPSGPVIASPNSPPRTGLITMPDNPIAKTAETQVQGAQNELGRMESTGSGISQIHNPFLRGLARVGDVAATGLFPNLERAIPGTEGHHRDLENHEQALINTGIREQQQEGQTELQAAQTQKDLNTIPPTSDLQQWIKQNTDPVTGQTKPIEEYWKQKTAADQKAGLTPQEQTYKYLTTSKEQGGLGLDPVAALDKVGELAAANKPDSKQQETQRLEGLLTKAMPGGKIDPGIMSDSKKLGNFIASSPNLSPDEKSQLLTHFIFNSSPASQGTQATIRVEGLENSRRFPSIDKTTGALAYPSAADMNANPDRYIPAQQGATSMTKEHIFADLHFNINQTREAIKDLKSPFDVKQRAQIAGVLRSSNPHSALDSFLNSTIGQTLQPDQIDYVTALASLSENAMAMRSIASMGQGSDEVRAAITRTIPGPNTPSVDYANRQLDLLEGTIGRLEKGVPASGTPKSDYPPIKKTGQQETGAGKTFTKSQITALANDKTKNPGGLTYEQLKADAESKGHKVDETK